MDKLEPEESEVVKMKPIIFSTPRVRAILDGKKTQTRRVVKINGCPITSPKESLELTKEGLIYHSFCSMSGYYKPLCQPGDILWVRETFFCEPCTEDCAGRNDENECPFNRVGNKCYGYKTQYAGGRCDGVKWRPSIHMSREAARIFLRVTNVRVERVQAITYDDCLREGLWDNGTDVDTLAAFQELWQNLNAKRGYGWEINPWVWVIEFEREEVEE